MKCTCRMESKFGCPMCCEDSQGLEKGGPTRHRLSYAQGSTSARARLMMVFESWFRFGRRWQTTAGVGVGQLSSFRLWISHVPLACSRTSLEGTI